MNTKRIVRWIVVLFLLAALPVMTAVMAQGQESAPQAPASWNIYESEPNDSRATADWVQVNDVIGGFIECRPGSSIGDWDFFRFQMFQHGIVLVEADWESIGSEDMYPDMWLIDSTGNELIKVGNGPSESDEAVLFYGLDPGIYYLMMKDHGHIGQGCGPNVKYEMSISSPLLVSAAAGGLANGGTVGGVHFMSEDILAWSRLNNGAEKWDMFFDGSDIGLTTNVTNIAAHGGHELLLSLAANRELQFFETPELVTPWDIVVFDGYLGNHTAGFFHWGLRGAEHGLTTASEKLDGIDGWVNGHDLCYGFPVSTVGVANTPSWGNAVVKADDEDIFCKVYNGSWEPWRYFFDVKGKNNAPSWWVPGPGRVAGMQGEDVTALSYNDPIDKMYMTIQGNGTIMGHPVTQKDIFAINFPDYTWGGIVWHGPDHGWNYNIDAIEYYGN